MKTLVLGIFISFLICSIAFGADQAKQPAKTKIILLIAEQNIEQKEPFAWWLSAVDLSATEATLAQRLIGNGYEILEPSALNKTISNRPAFRVVDVAESETIKLGKSCKADYVIAGKAVASAGGNIPQSNMRSCFANITAKVIRVSDGKVISYLNASGRSAHLDVISGGVEALNNAAGDLAVKVIEALKK